MNQRKYHIPRVNRSVLERPDIYVSDLFGGITVRQVWCEYHRRYEDVRLFYKESKYKSKYGGDVRNMCIEGWDLVYGSTKPLSNSTPAVSLTAFYDGENND